jgi:hypothetical protein
MDAVETLLDELAEAKPRHAARFEEPDAALMQELRELGYGGEDDEK